MKYAKNTTLGGFGLGWRWEDWARANTSLSEDEIMRLDDDSYIGDEPQILKARSNPHIVKFIEENPIVGVVIVEIPFAPEELTIINERGIETIAVKSYLY